MRRRSHFPGEFSSCRRRAAYPVHLSAEGAYHSRPARAGSGPGLQTFSWQSGRRSPESHSASATDAGSLREVLAVRLGAGRRAGLGGTVFRDSRRCRNCARRFSCVCAGVLFRLFVERIERHQLRLVVQQLVHWRDCFLVSGAGFEQRFWRRWWGIRRWRGRRGRGRLVEVKVWRCVAR
jgi:hypothetical protein